MAILERDLTLLSQAMVYPATPSLSARVRARLQAPPERPARARRWQLALAGVAAAAVLLAFVVSVVAPAREAVADLFDRINIFETETIPKGLPSKITGTRVTLEEAKARLGRSLLLPAYPPGATVESVLYQEFATNFGKTQAWVIYFSQPNGPQFVLFQTNARVGKGIPTDGVSAAKPIKGLGNEAYWLEGEHTVQYYDTAGKAIPESVRVTGKNTLIWDAGGFVFRIEGDLAQDETVRIAQSLR